MQNTNKQLRHQRQKPRDMVVIEAVAERPTEATPHRASKHRQTAAVGFTCRSRLLEKPFSDKTLSPRPSVSQEQRELPVTLQELLSPEEQLLLLHSPLQQQQQQLLLAQPQTSLQQQPQDILQRDHLQQQQQQGTLLLFHDPELPLLQKVDDRVAAAAATGNHK